MKASKTIFVAKMRLLQIAVVTSITEIECVNKKKFNELYND